MFYKDFSPYFDIDCFQIKANHNNIELLAGRIFYKHSVNSSNK